MYNNYHVCSRTTQIMETSRFQEEIRFCGIFPLDRGIAGVDAWGVAAEATPPGSVAAISLTFY